MVKINLLLHQHALRVKAIDGMSYIWDPVRRKWIKISPEEMVRQLVIQYLLDQGFSSRLLQVEKKLLYNNMLRRFDLVAYSKELLPFLLVECKSPKVVIDQAAFDQIAMYNMSLTVPFLWVTNGKTHYCCQMNYEEQTYAFLDHLPIPGE